MKTRATVFVALVAAATIGIIQLVAQTRNGRDDCVRYNPSTLRLTDEGDRGWLISRDDGARFMGLDTKEDAEAMMAVFKAHSTLCYVGRDNTRANRRDDVHEYWK
jgi:hypothetical protein